MNKAGQNTFKGINTQAKASLLLFLLNLKDRGFDSVTLEDKEWEDFTLNFKSGKKIICESKDWSRALSWRDVRGILNKILKRKSRLNKADEVTIVCGSVNQELEKGIKYLKHSVFGINDIYKKHGFTKAQTRLLARTSFFKIRSSKFLYQEALTYFADQILYWVPVEDLEMFMDSILIHDIYFKSEKGAIFTATELRKKIKDYKKHKIKASYAYDPERKKLEEQLKSILSGLHNPDLRALILNSDALTALTAQPSNMFFLLDQVKKQEKINLAKMDELWQALTKRLYASTMLRIIEENIDSSENAEYALGFIAGNYKTFTSPIRDTFNQEHCVDIANKIFEKHPDKVDKIFGFIKAVLKIRGKAYTKLENRRDYSRERELISKLLYKVYSYFQAKNDSSKIEEIIKLINKHFDLIDDDSKFIMFTPNSIFFILRDYINFDFEQNFQKILDLIIGQYQSSKWHKGKFGGWDLMGSGISQMGSQFSITDRHFITFALKSALKKYHKKNRGKAWRFILNKCITREEKKVSKNKPDFLNRAVIGILFERYKNEDKKRNGEVFGVLTDFLKMRKGIPHKTELIFQAVRDSDLNDEKKWNLVDEQLKYKPYKGLPANIFVEQIVFDLVSKNHPQASQIISEWVKNPEYNIHHMIGSYGPTDGVLKLLENNFGTGVNFLKNYLLTDDFIKKTNTFDTYNVARAVAKVLEADTEIGLEILEEIYRSKRLTTNQQVCICSGIYNVSGDERATLLKIYKQFLWPKLSSLLGPKTQKLKNLTEEDIKPVENRFSYAPARESLVEFAEKLASNRSFEEALNLVKIFIHDSDPPIDGNCERHQDLIEGKDSYAIGTVRGRCAWVLQKFVNLHGRKYMNEVVDWVKKLSKDDNYYIKLEACVPLIELMKIRHTHPPKKDKERFIPEKLAAEIENIAFNMLFDSKNQEIKEIMRYLAMTFSYMRTLGTDDAKKVLETFLNSEFDEVATKITPLLVYYVLFRKESFKNWPWKKLDKFDPDKFKKLFKKQLKEGRPAVRAKLAWQLERLPDEIKNTPEGKRSISISGAVKLSARHLLKLTDKYDRDVLNDIYRFIEEYIDDYFDLCFELWIECIKAESKYFDDNWSEGKLHEMYWWPFFYNGKVLVTILDNKDVEEFLTWFEKLANYPIEVLIANDLDVAVEKLVGIKNYKQRVKDLFDLLIKRNPKYYDFKQRWLKGKKDK